MIKFSLYKQNGVVKDRLICNKINFKGEVTTLRDVNDFNDILIRFLSTDYKVMVKKDTLYLFNSSTIFELLRFPEIINSNLLVRLKRSVLTKVSEDYLVPDKEDKKIEDGVNTKNQGFKSVVAEAFSNQITGAKVACTALLLSALMFTSLLIPLEKFISDENNSDLDTSFYDDNKKTLEFPISYDLIMGDEFILGHSLTNFKTLELTDNSHEVIKKPEISLAEKSLTVREREYLTIEMLDRLLISMCDGSVLGVNFVNSDEALDYLYENSDRTYPEKMLVVMAREGISYDQLDDICAGCRAEGGEYYDECYRVASVGYNRYRSINFINYFGEGLYTQFLAPSQFSVFYGEKTYLEFKGCIDSVGYKAAIDMFYSRKVSTDYLSFRGWWKEVPDDWESFMYHGNQFGDHQPEDDIYKLDYESVFEEEIAQDKLDSQNKDVILERRLEKYS